MVQLIPCRAEPFLLRKILRVRRVRDTSSQRSRYYSLIRKPVFRARSSSVIRSGHAAMIRVRSLVSSCGDTNLIKDGGGENSGRCPIWLSDRRVGRWVGQKWDRWLLVARLSRLARSGTAGPIGPRSWWRGARQFRSAPAVCLSGGRECRRNDRPTAKEAHSSYSHEPGLRWCGASGGKPELR